MPNSPGISLVVKESQCPRIPDEYTTVLVPPTFDDEDSWGTLALKYRDWGLAEWREMVSAKKWRDDHPGC